jgi:hypothetical protein
LEICATIGKTNHLRWKIPEVFQPSSPGIAGGHSRRRGYDNPRRASPSGPSQFHAHDLILAESKKSKKPTVGFQATFFVIAPTAGNCFPTMDWEHTKGEKVKKCLHTRHYFWPDPLFFCQNGPFGGRFWLSNYYMICKWLHCCNLHGLQKQRFCEKPPQ